MAPLDLLNNAPERKAQSMPLAESIDLFPRQMWVCRRCSSGCLVLLCLDGLAFPASGHGWDYTFRWSSPTKADWRGEGRSDANAAPILGRRFVPKTELGEKTDYFPCEMWL